MSDVIDVLERLGQDAQWSQASQEDIRSVLAESSLDPDVRKAVASGDQKRLEMLLGLVPLCGMMVPGREDEKEDEDTEESPPGEEEEKPEHSISDLQVSAT
jgi:hypothetical protein